MIPLSSKVLKRVLRHPTKKVQLRELRSSSCASALGACGHAGGAVLVFSESLPQGNESRLTRLWLQRAESVQQVLRVPGGTLAAALD